VYLITTFCDYTVLLPKLSKCEISKRDVPSKWCRSECRLEPKQ